MKRSLPLALILFSLGLASLAGCQSVKVDTDYDEAVDFAQYQTFDWLPERPEAPRNPQINDVIDNRIRRAIERAMEADGYQRTTTERSDLYVVYHAAVERKLGGAYLNTLGYGQSAQPGPMRLESYQEGTLIIDLVDVLRRELVWRGTATGAVTNLIQAEKKLFGAIERIFAKFPPEDS